MQRPLGARLGMLAHSLGATSVVVKESSGTEGSGALVESRDRLSTHVGNMAEVTSIRESLKSLAGRTEALRGYL